MRRLFVRNAETNQIVVLPIEPANQAAERWHVIDAERLEKTVVTAIDLVEQERCIEAATLVVV